MKIRQWAAFALLVVGGMNAFAQDTTNTVIFNGFTLSYDASLATNVNITQFAGDPVDMAYPGGPQSPYIEFSLYTGTPAPEAYTSPIVVRVYQTADFANYPLQATELTNLQQLLAERPDLSIFSTPQIEGMSGLPALPVFPAAQVLTGQAQYVDTGVFTGIRYITVYRQDASPVVSSEFMYTFQGLSADASVYVSVVAWVNASMFPTEIPSDFNYDAFITTINDYFVESATKLNTGAPTDFTPSLAPLDALVNSMQLGN